MPGTGPLRRSSTPARKKAIVGKSRVEPELLQSPAFVFLLFVNGLRFQAAAFNSRSSVFALEVLLTPTRRHVDTVLHYRVVVAELRLNSETRAPKSLCTSMKTGHAAGRRT
jgi:hypothetical protein